MLDGLDEVLPGHYRLAVARAELLGRDGQAQAARSAYLLALDRCTNDSDRRELTRRVHQLDG